MQRMKQMNRAMAAAAHQGDNGDENSKQMPIHDLDAAVCVLLLPLLLLLLLLLLPPARYGGRGTRLLRSVASGTFSCSRYQRERR